MIYYRSTSRNTYAATYSRYERGTRDIPAEVLIMLANYYHTSVDYLLGLIDTIKPYPPKKK